MFLKCFKIWVILLVLWTANKSYADDTIVFTEPTQIYNTIQELNKCEELNVLHEYKISELNNANDNYKLLIENDNQKIKELEDMIQNINEFKLEQDKAVENLQQLLRTQKDGYEKLMQDSKPKFFDELFKSLGYIAFGLIIGLLI